METTFSKSIKMTAVLPVFLVLPAATASEPILRIAADSQFSSQPAVDQTVTVMAKEDPVFSFKEPAKEWTKPLAARFQKLSMKEAFEELTADEMVEIEKLANDRRNLEYPRPVEEVLWEYEQRKITADLVKALRAYAKFHRTSNKARS